MLVVGAAILSGCGGGSGADAGRDAESACRGSVESLTIETEPTLTDATRSGTGPWKVTGTLAAQADREDQTWSCEIRLDDDGFFRGQLEFNGEATNFTIERG